MSWIRNIVVLVFGCLSVIPAWADQYGCQQKTVTVSIGTKDDSPAPEIDRTNLEGTHRKKPIRIVSAVLNQEPPRVVLLLDISGSMHGLASSFDINLSLNVAEDLITHLPSASEIGLGFFYKGFVPVVPPSIDRTLLRGQIESLRTHPASFRGKTALWSAILKGVDLFDHPHWGDVIYVITDGGDNASKVTTNHVVQTLTEFDIRLFAFVLQRIGRTTREEESGPGSVLEAVEDTGGASVTLRDDTMGSFSGLHGPADIYKSGNITPFGSQLRSQYRQISDFYRVQIDLPEAIDKQQEWKLDLAGFSKSQREKLVLRYPHIFVPCH